jgi:hypothetical protein
MGHFDVKRYLKTGRVTIRGTACPLKTLVVHGMDGPVILVSAVEVEAGGKHHSRASILAHDVAVSF